MPRPGNQSSSPGPPGTDVTGPPATEVGPVAPPEPPSIVGQWVTSFTAFYPGSPPTADPNVSEGNNWIVGQIAPLIPTAVATLACFVFEDDGTFYAENGRNLGWGFREGQFNGDYEFIWHSKLQVPGGEIIIRFEPGVSVTLKFFMRGPDELKFILAHGNSVDDPVPSAAGTMRRVQFAA